MGFHNLTFPFLVIGCGLIVSMVILTVEHLYKMIKSKVENEKINETPQEQEETTEIVEPTEERKIEFPTPTY